MSRRDIAPKYLHDRRPGQAIPGCTCDACRRIHDVDLAHYDHMASVFGLTEEDVEGVTDERRAGLQRRDA